MTAKEIVDRFKNLASKIDGLDFRSFEDDDFFEILEPIFGSYEMVDETIDEDDDIYRREFIAVKFHDHNVIIQEIKSYNNNKLTNTVYWTAVPKVVTHTLYNADEEII